MINPTDKEPTFTPSPAPLNEQTSRLRGIMAKVVSSLGFIKLHTPPPIDPFIVEKTKELEEILDDLDRVKKEFKTKLNPELHQHVLGIISPMERHLKKLQGRLAEQKLPDTGEGWVTKAKVWTQLKGKPLHEAAIMSHLITHLISEVESSIRQDFQVIQVYLIHRMDTLRLSAEERESLHEKLKKPLEDLGQEIRNLALVPAKASLDAFKDWRTAIDTKRQQHHEAALELIDRHLPKKTKS